MTKLKFVAALPVIALLMCSVAHAETTPAKPPAPPAKMGDGMVPPHPPTDAEREEMRKKLEAMTPEQRAALKEQMEARHKEMKAKIDAMTPEQKAEFHKKMEERKAEWEKEHPGQHLPEHPPGMPPAHSDADHAPPPPPKDGKSPPAPPAKE